MSSETSTNERLAVRLIRLTNIGGIEGTLEVPLGDITYLEGTNGVGKSSVVDGLAALCGGSVTDLLNLNADEGEVYLELTDDTWFRRRINRAGKNDLTAGHPEQGSIGRAASWLRATLSAASLSPADFLEADDAKAAEYILRTAPLTVTAEEVAEAMGDGFDAPEVNVDDHALTVLDSAIKELYAIRREENRVAKESRTTTEQLQRSIPEDVPDPVALGQRVGELDALLVETQQGSDAAETEATRGARREADEEIATLGATIVERDDSVAQLVDSLAEARGQLALVESKRDQVVVRRDERAEEAASRAAAPFVERLATANAELTAARDAHQAATSAEAALENTRQMIAKQEGKAQAAHDRSRALTKAMAGLEGLKAAKAAALPVAGVSIEGGKLYIGDVPAHRANTAERVRVALDASTVQKARIRFVFADRLESLAAKARDEVERACKDRGIQILGARLTEGETLTVRGDGTAVAAEIKPPCEVSGDGEAEEAS